MTVRQRARRTQARTEVHAWDSERDEAIIGHGSVLERYQRFWENEPGIPTRLRRKIVGYVAHGGSVISPYPDRLIDHLEKRRRWLADHGLPHGVEELTAAEPVR